AIAATSLNLILGYGGMVSFGHAVYLGVGGYAVGILAHEGVGSGFVQWPAALAVSALFALIVGALSLRTRGVYFIMITLAFALLAIHADVVTPAVMHWTRAGDLIVMVVLGGMGSSFGPLIGAVTLLVLEEALPVLIRWVAFPFIGSTAVRVAEYWQIVLGPLFLLVVLFARGGINGL